MDPITAIAQAAGSMFETWGKGLDVLKTSFQKKVVREQNKGLALLNETERIKYDELISNGNYSLAAQLLQSRDEKESSNNNYVSVILIGFFLIVLVIIYLKLKQR